MSDSESQSSGLRSDIHSEACPKCGSPLKMKHVGQQSFWGCTSYPDCDYTQPLHETTGFEPEDLPGEKCPECGGQLQLKKGRYGFFVGCQNFPTCDFIINPTADQDEADNITCPNCSEGSLTLRSSKYGKRFWSCSRYPDCSYSLNDKPVSQPCPECHWPVLTEKRVAGSVQLRCPQKQCGYKLESL